MCFVVVVDIHLTPGELLRMRLMVGVDLGHLGLFYHVIFDQTGGTDCIRLNRLYVLTPGTLLKFSSDTLSKFGVKFL